MTPLNQAVAELTATVHSADGLCSYAARRQPESGSSAYRTLSTVHEQLHDALRAAPAHLNREFEATSESEPGKLVDLPSNPSR